MKHAIRPHTTSLVATALSPIVAGAATLTVPGQYATIQSAIDAASASGDTVLVSPGTYAGAGNRNLDLGGKRLGVVGKLGAKVTIIDCEGEGRGFRFQSREPREASVEGLTILNGFATGTNFGKEQQLRIAT